MPNPISRARSTEYGYRINPDSGQYERYYLRGSKGPVTAKRAQNIARQEAKRCMQRLAEKKHNTYAVGHGPVSATGNVDSLTIMSQGSSAVTRTGNQVHISMLDITGVGSIAVGSAGDLVRIIVGWDTEPNGTAVTVGTVLESAALQAAYNKDQVKPGGRIQIISDKTMDLNAMTATVGNRLTPYRFKKKLDKVVYYQSNAGTISDVLKNNLFVLSISLSGLATTAMNAQICYTDL